MPAADQESSWRAWPTTPALLTRRPTLHWFCLPSSHRRLPVHGWSTYCARGGRYSRLIPRPRPNVNQRLTSGPQLKPLSKKVELLLSSCHGLKATSVEFEQVACIFFRLGGSPAALETNSGRTGAPVTGRHSNEFHQIESDVFIPTRTGRQRG